ncbi:MAG: hypothetical protein AAFY46_10420, partial [Planctomycetota bacterium]
AADQAQTGNTETQLRTLRTQIQLFRAQSDTNEFPALVDGGTDANATWADMIDADLIQAPPINPRSNSAIVSIDDTATGQAGQDAAAGGDATDGGWLYNSTTGEIWAIGFNEDYDQDGNDEWGF